MEEKIVLGYIYKITNNINQYVYIGKTTYNNIKKRFNQHKFYAKNGGGSKNSLHQAIRDYGIENFSIEIIDTVYKPDSLEQKEKNYIKKYHSYIGDPDCKGYNQSKGGEGTHYIEDGAKNYLSENIVKLYKKYKNQTKVAQELKIDTDTVRNYLKSNNIKIDDAKTIAIRETGKKVAIYNNNKLIAVFPSLGEAARHFEDREQASHISEVCYGKRNNVKGYTAEFTDKEIFNQDVMLPTLNLETRKNKKKAVEMIDIKTGEVLKIFESGCEVGRYFEMERPQSATTCISRTIKRDGTWRGYKWRRID